MASKQPHAPARLSSGAAHRSACGPDLRDSESVLDDAGWFTAVFSESPTTPVAGLTLSTTRRLPHKAIMTCTTAC
jgi:hypothetical protein